MGVIKDTATGRAHVLEPEHFVGRGSWCALRLTEKYVSSQHAVIRWTGEAWEVKDLGSRNGTFVDGQRIAAGAETVLREHATIAFGKRGQEWRLEDGSAPTVMAVPEDDTDPVLIDGELLAVPSIDNPEVTIYPGGDGQWMLEQPDSTIPVTNLQTFVAAGKVWRFCSVDRTPKTALATASSLAEARHASLTFSVSRDEEHVHLQVSLGGATHDLGTRGHNYLLLTLARARLADASVGHPDSTCGWVYVEDLAHDPSMGPPQLNIDIFRIRKQFASIGVVDAASIVERRPRTRQLRIGTGNLRVLST